MLFFFLHTLFQLDLTIVPTHNAGPINASHNILYHSHQKRKDNLETRVLLLIFSLELEIFEVAVQRIHQNSKKWWLL